MGLYSAKDVHITGVQNGGVGRKEKSDDVVGRAVVIDEGRKRWSAIHEMLQSGLFVHSQLGLTSGVYCIILDNTSVREGFSTVLGMKTKRRTRLSVATTPLSTTRPELQLTSSRPEATPSIQLMFLTSLAMVFAHWRCTMSKYSIQEINISSVLIYNSAMHSRPTVFIIRA